MKFKPKDDKEDDKSWRDVSERVAVGGRAKFATGRFLLFKRIPIFFASNFSETAWTTSTCSFDVFSEEDSNSIIRKTVHRTNILLLLLLLLLLFVEKG